MQYAFMLENQTTYAVFILGRLHEENFAKVKKLYMCFVYLEKTLDRKPRIVVD